MKLCGKIGICVLKKKGINMEDDFFDNFNDDSDDFEHLELIERFEKMLDTHTTSFFDKDDYALLFEHYFYSGKMNKAQKALSLGLKQYPDSIMLQLKKVHYLIYTQKQDEALKLLNENDNNVFDNTDILLEKAYLFAQLKQYDQSIKIYKKLLQLENEEKGFLEDIYLGLADVYEQKGDEKKTLKCLQKALELDPDNEYLISGVSDAFFNVVNEEEKHEIVSYFFDFVQKNSFSSAAWCYLGIAYYEINLYEKAIESFDYALALDEKNEEALLYEMKSYFKLNERKKANEVFFTLLNMTRFKDLLWHQLGNSFYEAEEYENALVSYQNSIDENDEFSISYAGKAFVYAAQNDYNKAIESIRKAIELDRENPEYWLLLGEYLNRNGKINEAEEMFTFAADHFPNESDVWLFYSDFYVMNQQVEKAIEVLYKGIDIHPDNISYLYRMANYYYLKDDAIQGNSFLTLAYISSPELLDEFLEYDEKMYDIPDVVNFLTNINNINE